VTFNILFRILGSGLGSGHGGGHGGQQIPIISYTSENTGDGNYQYSYETGNGITVQETGHRQGTRLRFRIRLNLLFHY